MKISSSRFIGSVLVSCGALVGACASSAGPSQQLQSARTAYDQAARGPAGRYSPDELLEARNLLEEAEEADDGSSREKHLAYLADRQARRAAAEGATQESERRLAEANRTYVTLQEQGRVAAERGLSATQRQLTESQKAQREAEERATKAMASLEAFGAVQEKENETTLTLSNEVLFATGESTLLPVAERRLDAVARALSQLGTSRVVVIEGHTDSRGSEESNERLSKDRAEAVRGYLIGRGLSPAQLTAVGKGESEPIADNETAEGRANNRRVELVITKTSE